MQQWGEALTRAEAGGDGEAVRPQKGPVFKELHKIGQSKVLAGETPLLLHSIGLSRTV